MTAETHPTNVQHLLIWMLTLFPVGLLFLTICCATVVTRRWSSLNPMGTQFLTS